jgi:hypothetical protein
MTREFLKSLGIEDKAVIDSIMGENGKDINAEKTKFGDYETLKTQLSDANKKIEEFGKLDFDGVKAMADDYKAKFEQAQADGKKQLDELRFNHALDSALGGAKAKNIKAVKALLETDKLKLNKDGSLTGLSEQLDKIKSENDYLFEMENSPSPAPHFLGGSHGAPSSADDDAVRAIMGLPPISK